MDLDLYRDFVTTVARGSITSAARALGTSRPTLSRRLARLEAELGLALLHRSTRSLELTPAGRRLHDQVAPLVADLERIQRAMWDERADVRGLLRVSVPPVLAPALASLLVALGRTHPQLRIELVAEVRKAELRSEEIEVALRAGAVDDPDLVSRRIGDADVGAVASPAYLASTGTPVHPDDLARHRLLLGHGARGRPQRFWPLHDGGRIAVEGVVTTNDQQLLAELAVAGGGIALLSAWTSTEPLAAGRLVPVLPDQVGVRLPIHLVLTRRDRQPARVRAFVDALLEWAASHV